MELFISTRGNERGVTAPQAVLRGIAPDVGLYIRRNLPHIPVEELSGASFHALARRVLGDYLSGYSEDDICDCVDKAYDDKFDTPEIAPVVSVGDMHVLELFHGPTAAFKDIALSALPRLMSSALGSSGSRDDILILTATSGDTGSAALTGFADVPGIRIIVFFPDKGISPIQRAQMTTMRGDNLGVCAISGNFDDAQTGVKRIFAELPRDFLSANHVSLSSANSINIGRLAPQIVYYYSAYLALVKQRKLRMGDKLNFCVPTGNFGDILAGYYAKLMGLPVGRLICASNANDVLTDFINTGVYDRRRKFLTTISPSMDILVSSNLERLLWLALDGDAQAVRTHMEALAATGTYTMPDSAMAKIRQTFSAGRADDAQAMAAIRKVFEGYHYLMDPHTAVAWHVAQQYRAETGDLTPCVVLSTASPYKFPQSVLTALGVPVPENAVAQLHAMEELSGTRVPTSLRSVLDNEPRFRDVIRPEVMMDYVMERVVRR